MPTLPTIRIGSRGVHVGRVQAAVGVRVDEDYGPVTERAVMTFQAAHGLAADGVVGPKTWARLTAGVQWPPTAPPGIDPGLALVAVASQMLGVSEGPVSNRGDRVDDILRLGGYRVPASARTEGPPWCAWLVSACSQAAINAGYLVWRPEPRRRGLAVAPWIDAPDERKIPRGELFDRVRPGDVMCRTRVSAPVSDRAKVLRGISTQGHTAILEHADRATRTLHVLAGNSTGRDHAKTSGTVAREVIREGDKAWDRLAGFVRIAGDL